jgi:hypothetical protein
VELKKHARRKINGKTKLSTSAAAQERTAALEHAATFQVWANSKAMVAAQ